MRKKILDLRKEKDIEKRVVRNRIDDLQIQTGELEMKNEAGKIRHKLVLKKAKRIFSITLLILFIVFSIVIIFTSFTFLRYRQICQYSKLVENGEATATNNNLCPNILDKNQWKAVITEAFTPSTISNIKVSESYTNSTIISTVGSCNANTDPICWLKQLKGDLKNSNGVTNIMLIGTDSRAHKIEGNTDSIMIASFDNVSGKVLLISIPRDLFVRFKTPYGSDAYTRVNSIYAIYGIDTLKGALETITGKPIQYYVFLNFDVFNTVIDQLGGIDIVLPKPFLNVYPRPDTEAAHQHCNPADFAPDGFCVFQFPAGPQHFTSFQALVYARSRELTTDWDRAGRQQEIVTAVMKNSLSKSNSIQDKFSFYTNLYNTIVNNVDTNITINDIGGMFKYVDKLSASSARVVLDPYVDNGKLVYQYGLLAGYGDVSKVYDYSYNSLHKYLSGISDYLPYYLDTPKILIINGTKNPIPDSSKVQQFIKANIPYTSIQQSTNTTLGIKGLRIYDFTNGSKQGTLDDIMKRISDGLIYNAELDGITQSKFGEDILIVYGG